MVDAYGRKCSQDEKIDAMNRLDFVPMKVLHPDIPIVLLACGTSETHKQLYCIQGLFNAHCTCCGMILLCYY